MESPTEATEANAVFAANASASDDALADETAEEIFGSEDNARKTVALVTSFVSSWERHKHEKTPADWLADEFRKYPSIWNGDEEIVATANEIVGNVEGCNADHASLHDHLDAGKSKASWLANKIEEGAAAAGASSVGAYAANVEQTLKVANSQMLETFTTRSGAINSNPNLDGLVAERHHTDTFNLDAAAKGSSLRAEVRESLGKNSVDIVIKDGNGRIVRRYQSKYGRTAEATQKLFEKGDYRGQKKLVPDGQEDAVTNATNAIELDGVSSQPLTKDEAKRQQEKAQQEEEIRQYEWNEVNRIEIAKSIGKQALAASAWSCAFQGARVLGRRVWNFFRGQENPPVSDDIQDFFESSVKGAAHVGVQTAVCGAAVVAAKNGWISLLQNTPVRTVVSIVHGAMENAKVLWKFAKGDLSMEQALDEMGTTTASLVGGLAGAAKGAAVGALAGPFGSFVGGIVGGIAGSKIGEAVWEASKRLVTAATKTISGVLKGTVEVVKSVGRALNPFNWF